MKADAARWSCRDGATDGREPRQPPGGLRSLDQGTGYHCLIWSTGEGCYGARMTGAGSGGCAIALVQRAVATTAVDVVTACYPDAKGMEARAYVCSAAEGDERSPVDPMLGPGVQSSSSRSSSALVSRCDVSSLSVWTMEHASG